MAQIYEIFTSLADKNENCLVKLEEIWKKLVSEDQTLRPYRRAIGFGQNLRKDLLPLLLCLKDDNDDTTKLIDMIIRIFVNLTVPIDYLLSIDLMLKTDYGQHTINELNHLLLKSKECFTDNRNIKLIIDHMKFLIDNNNIERNTNYCDSINNCLLLIRNILHIPETITKTNNSNINNSSMQNQIIWNLFTQSIDKIIIYLITCPQKMYWNVTIVQLIALLYKDQHIGKLEKLLNLWLECTLSDSSDDNESNTSPPEQGGSSGDDYSSSPIITSDPTTSDSSDNGGCGNKNRINNKSAITKITNHQNRNKTCGIRGKSIETESGSSTSGVASNNDSNCSDNKNQTPNNGNNNIKRESCQSEDFGYATQVENQESISTSSNEDDQPPPPTTQQKPTHQKTHAFQKTRSGKSRTNATTPFEKKELRRKKLVKRSKANTINMKGLMHHLPTDDDISNILKEFTVDFLLKGYNILVDDLYKQLLTNIKHVQIDTSHFFWLITYFLKFATQLELDLEHVHHVLSIDILTFLIFQGIWIYEEFEISCKINTINTKPCLRRLHLVVTATHEFLQAIEAYRKMLHLNDDDRSILTKLQQEIVEIDDLRLLFLLLLRQYNANLQSKQYLKDLIITNHNYLLFLDRVTTTTTTTTDKTNGQRSFNIMEHLKQFATNKIMYQYGLLLENFKNNGEYVNNCIFTMMHHIGGDLNHINTLFQPIIIKTFSQIWETEYEICDDWSDLIEYMIHKFINTPHSSSETSTTLSENDDLELIEWSKEDKDNLLNYYNQSKHTQDTIANIREKYKDDSIKHKTQLSIIQQLLEQNIINEAQYNEFIRIRQPDVDKENNKQSQTQPKIINNNNNNNNNDDVLIDGDIKVLKQYLYKENKGKFIQWLQEILINICYVKLVLTNIEEFGDDNVPLRQPIIYYYTCN